MFSAGWVPWACGMLIGLGICAPWVALFVVTLDKCPL